MYRHPGPAACTMGQNSRWRQRKRQVDQQGIALQPSFYGMIELEDIAGTRPGGFR